MKDTPKVLVIAGASGSGKSTLVKYILNKYPEYFELSISYTTRPPRETETNNKEYHFITQDQFNKKIENNEFLEYAEYAGHSYGTGIEYTNRTPNDKILILEIEKKGVQSIKHKGIPCVYLFIHVPIAYLHERISKRALITENELSKRLMKAEEENQYGTSGAFNCIINNISLEIAIRDLNAFISSSFNIPANK
ncbi:guanylate kinase [Nematocida sp. AWRm80]|nr:guanylate kinase [Nematocida sp. AWRm80]